VLLLRRCLD